MHLHTITDSAVIAHICMFCDDIFFACLFVYSRSRVTLSVQTRMYVCLFICMFAGTCLNTVCVLGFYAYGRHLDGGRVRSIFT